MGRGECHRLPLSRPILSTFIVPRQQDGWPSGQAVRQRSAGLGGLCPGIPAGAGRSVSTRTFRCRPRDQPRVREELACWSWPDTKCAVGPAGEGIVASGPAAGAWSAVLEEVVEELHVTAIASRCASEGEAEVVQSVLDTAVVDGHPCGRRCGQDS